MPRGVYDRTKAKQKRLQQLAGTPTVATPMKATPVASAAVSASTDISALNQHLSLLVNTRAGIMQIQHDHNPQLIATVDNEIIATVNTLKAWRESSYPLTTTKSQPQATATPSYVPTPIAPAPLPFTPAQVQDALKGNAAQAPQGA